MTSKFRQQADDAGRADQHRLLSEPDDLLHSARHYFAEDFPNPASRDCPDRRDWLALINSGGLPDEACRSHLFGCSACFRAYRELLAARQRVTWHDASWSLWASRWARPATRAALLAAALLLLAAGLTIWHRLRHPATVISQQTVPATQSLAPPLETPATRGTAPTQSRPLAEPSLARQSVRLDLEAYAALRGAGAQPNQMPTPLRLAAVPTTLTLRLPEHSPVGRYRVSVLNAFGRTLAAAGARSQDGRSLTVRLDLSQLTPRGCRLSVARADEAPDYYPVEIAPSSNGGLR